MVWDATCPDTFAPSYRAQARSFGQAGFFLGGGGGGGGGIRPL